MIEKPDTKEEKIVKLMEEIFFGVSNLFVIDHVSKCKNCQKAMGKILIHTADQRAHQ